MMKKISLKGVKQSFQRRNRSRSSNEDLGVHVGDGLVMESMQDKNLASPSSARSGCCDCGEIQIVAQNDTKKERKGLFKTFKRRLTTSFRKKSDTSSVEEGCQCLHPRCGGRSDKGFRARKKNKQNLSSSEISKSNSSSHSHDSVDICGRSPVNCGGTVSTYANYKLTNLECNTDSADYSARKDKAICRSKDITHFQVSHFSPKCNSVSEEGVSASQMKLERLNIPRSCPKSGQCVVESCPKKDNLEVDKSCEHFQESLRLWEVEEAPKVWSLTQELFKLSKFSWYWGPITRTEAEDKLLNQPDGAFLVRDSSDERYLLSLSFRSYGKTLHTRIEHCNGMFSFYAQPDSEGYSSIVDLIQYSMNDSQSGLFCYSRPRSHGAPSFTVRLTKPMSRFTQVRSLQYMCRFVIRQYTRYDHIQQLPLPSRIKGWIEENQY